MKPSAILLAAAVAAVAPLARATIFETNDQQRANLATVATWTAAEAARASGADSVKVERALRLDRAAGEVVVLAEFCDISSSATVEFPIVGETSDRDYEALFRTFARPGAIARAIEALGVPRGRNVDTAALSFWPYGERVAIDVAPFAATNAANAAFKPIQSFIVDMRTRAPLAYDSFVYCGSPDDPESKDGGRLCDAEAPNSVFSTYNESQTVIDMPAACPQSDVYERFLLASDSGLVPFSLYKIRIRPARRADGERRVRDYALEVRKGDAGIAYDLALNGKTERLADAEGLLARFREAVEAGFDPFVSVRFGGEVTLEEAAAQARMLSRIEGEKGIRVAAPGAGEVYYKGFLPNQNWRVPKDRPSQPWVLRIQPAKDGAAPISLVKTFEDWTSTDSLDPILTFKTFDAATPEEALAAVEANGHGLPVLLVFAPGSTPLADIMPTVRLLRPRHPTVYFFAE